MLVDTAGQHLNEMIYDCFKPGHNPVLAIELDSEECPTPYTQNEEK